jgi:phosphoenolpyruvate synthase/pyruvate phosphate dikinase
MTFDPNQHHTDFLRFKNHKKFSAGTGTGTQLTFASSKGMNVKIHLLKITKISRKITFQKRHLTHLIRR